MIRVLVAEDEEPVRAAICDLIAAEEGFEVVAVAADAREAIAGAGATHPDVALLDVRMPGGGAHAAAEIRSVSPGTRSVALSASDQPPDVLAMLRGGAVGYVVKGEPPAELIEVIRRAARGEASLSAALLAGLVGALGHGGGGGALGPDVPDWRGALGDSERRYRALLESAPDAVAISDAAGRIVLVNRETERLLGYAREELIGRPIEVLLASRFEQSHARARVEYTSNPCGRPMGTGIELTARRKDGREIPVDISLATTETDEGRLVTAYIRDITEQKARQELERIVSGRQAVLGYLVRATETERQSIAENIHDDSIQVMTAASMRLQILRRSLDDPEQLGRLDELQRTIQLAIARLRRLLFELHPPSLDTQGLATAVREYLEESCDESSTDYRLDDRLRSEPERETRLIIYRIAQEALTNVARHAEAAHASVTLAERDGGYLTLVEDDGIGFVPESLTPKPGHLGLSTLRERAELAGGWLRVASTPGNGTCVEFWIPARGEQAPDNDD